MARTPDWMPTTYAEAARLLGSRSERKIGHNTYVETQGSREATIVVRYHGTNIVTFRPDGAVVLRTGGYSTATTKARLAVVASAYGYVLSQRDYVWTLTHRATGTVVPWSEGVDVSDLSLLQASA